VIVAVESHSSELIPLLRIDVSLIENTAQRSDWNFGFSRHNHSVDETAARSHKLHVASSLANLHEACGLKTPLDLAKGLRLKPTQPLPQQFAPSADD
jgi:hypothetical protein